MRTDKEIIAQLRIDLFSSMEAHTLWLTKYQSLAQDFYDACVEINELRAGVPVNVTTPEEDKLIDGKWLETLNRRLPQ